MFGPGFYISSKGSRNSSSSSSNNNNNNNNNNNDAISRGKSVIPGYREPEKKPDFEPGELRFSNVERFLEAIAPSVPVQHFSKTTTRGFKTCDVEFQPYFLLSDLWESFKERSAYGAGVPLVLNNTDSVIQYYVPYLSGIQIYIDPSKSPLQSRRTSEDSDGDYFSRDSSSNGSSDSERDKALMNSKEQWNSCILPSDISLKMERLLLGDKPKALHEGSSSDEGESGTTQGYLLFQYFEHEPPYCREPLADKISDLALRFPELKSLRSCDILPSSWLSVAWYPIYRIPMGPTLKDLEACFLTYHSLHTPLGDAPTAPAPVVIYPNEMDRSPRISRPVFGLAIYKFRGSLWISSSGSDRQLVKSLLQAADGWLKLLQVHHPDYSFFCRNSWC